MKSNQELEFELWKNVEELCNNCKIMCSKCLDTKKLWKYEQNNNTHIILWCTKCCGGALDKTVKSSKEKDIFMKMGEYDKEILIMGLDDNTAGYRLQLLKQLQIYIIEKNKKEEEILINNMLIEFNDGSNEEKFDKSEIKEYTKNTKNTNINIEVGNIMKQIVQDLKGVHNFSIDNVQFNFEFKFFDVLLEQTVCKKIENEKKHPVYLFFIVSVENYSNIYKWVDCCGVISSETKITIKQIFLYPKNNKALEKCDKMMSDITNKKIDDLLDFYKK